MISKVLSTTAVVLAAATVASAQTFTHCNPLQKTCPADPAFGNQQIDCNFADGACDAFHNLDGTDITYSDQGALFTIKTETNAPTIATNNYIFFGRLDVELIPAPGAGVVTSLVLQSDDLDEIDWEWVGADTDQVQSNYFYKGDTTTYDRGAYHPVPNAIGSAHTYSIEWTSEQIQWIVNGAVVRTLLQSDVGENYPQTPMQIKLGTWVAGRKDAPDGTVEWAGGYTDFSQAPFNAYYKTVKITDYAGGSSAATTGIKEYVYSDNSGDWQSIKVVKGDSELVGDDDSSDDSGDKDSSSSTTKEDASVTVIEPTSISRKYEKPSTTIKPSSAIPTTFDITPSFHHTTASQTKTTESAEKTTSSSSSSSSSEESSQSTNTPEASPDAAGTMRVAAGTLALVAFVAVAQLF